MPYRLDLRAAPQHAAETLIDLGALDVDTAQGGLSALMPDTVSVETVAKVLGVAGLHASIAVGRDDGSVWTLRPRAVRAGPFAIVPADQPFASGDLRIIDSASFGTGMHATTALCLEWIAELVGANPTSRMLDVGTGSGILALAALQCGVQHATCLDIDADALHVARRNAQLNHVSDRVSLVLGDGRAVRGQWPLVVANIRAAELIDAAPALAPRVASRGHLVLSGIPHSTGNEVARTYERAGMRQAGASDRDGWKAMVFIPTW